MKQLPYGAAPLDPTGLGFVALTLPLVAPLLGLALVALAAQKTAESPRPVRAPQPFARWPK